LFGRNGRTVENASRNVLGRLLDTLFGIKEEVPKAKNKGEFATQNNRNFRNQILNARGVPRF
jgi:hypothetical protein